MGKGENNPRRINTCNFSGTHAINVTEVVSASTESETPVTCRDCNLGFSCLFSGEK